MASVACPIASPTRFRSGSSSACRGGDHSRQAQHARGCAWGDERQSSFWPRDEPASRRALTRWFERRIGSGCRGGAVLCSAWLRYRWLHPNSCILLRDGRTETQLRPRQHARCCSLELSSRSCRAVDADGRRRRDAARRPCRFRCGLPGVTPWSHKGYADRSPAGSMELKLGVLGNFESEKHDVAIAPDFDNALEELSRLGAEIRSTTLPSYDADKGASGPDFCVSRSRRPSFMVICTAANPNVSRNRCAIISTMAPRFSATQLVRADRRIEIAAFELQQVLRRGRRDRVTRHAARCARLRRRYAGQCRNLLHPRELRGRTGDQSCRWAATTRDFRWGFKS